MQGIDLTPDDSVLSEFVPPEIVMLITNMAVKGYYTGNARHAQRRLLAAVCKRLYTEYKPKRKYNLTAAMTSFVRDPNHIDLWMTLYNLGARVDYIAILKYSVKSPATEHITQLCAHNCVLTYDQLDDIRMQQDFINHPEGLIAIWRHQDIPYNYFTARFEHFRNAKIYEYIASKWPEAPIDIYMMIRKGIPEAIGAYYCNVNYLSVLHKYTNLPGLSPKLLAKFMRTCNIKIKCDMIRGLLTSIQRPRCFTRLSDNEQYAELLTNCMKEISPFVVCGNCPDNMCINYVIINNYSFDPREAVRESNLTSKCYKRTYGQRTLGTIIEPLDLLTSITKADNMFMMKDSIDQGVLTKEFITSHLRLINKTKQCYRWLATKGIVVHSNAT
ncbi:hypothetical protein F-LCD7_0170 [Faustovirus]|nr:hypothetical protein F-LCD7_0170 [Faustovirus]